MACRYYNDEKSDPWNGIYCEYMGGRPGVRYWNCYCDGDYSRCPKLGGDDPYELDPETVWKRQAEEERKKREEERLRREREYREEQERIRERERQEEQERNRRNLEKKQKEDASRNRSSSGQTKQQYGNSYQYVPDDSVDQSYADRRSKNYRSSSSGMMTKVVLVLVGLLILIGGGWYAGAKTGLIKSTVTVSAKAPTSGLIPVNEVSLKAIVQDGVHKESSAKFDENGQCKLKLHPGMNAVYVEYDGTSVYLDSYLGNGFKQHAVDLNLDIAEQLMLRVLIVELQDKNGTRLFPENVKVSDANGESITCKAVQEGMYVMIFGNETMEETLTISADGYEALDVSAGLSGRLSHMVITLAEK